MYWYKGYSSISAVVSVSVTKCQAIQVDACSFTENCRFLTVKCNPYLKGITKNTNMKLTMQHQSKAVKFSLPEKNCVVLMVASWEDHLTYIDLQFMFKARCQFTLLSEPGTNAIGPISAYTTKERYIFVVGHTSCFTSDGRKCKRMIKEMSLSRMVSTKIHERVIQVGNG